MPFGKDEGIARNALTSGLKGPRPPVSRDASVASYYYTSGTIEDPSSSAPLNPPRRSQESSRFSDTSSMMESESQYVSHQVGDDGDFPNSPSMDSMDKAFESAFGRRSSQDSGSFDESSYNGHSGMEDGDNEPEMNMRDGPTSHLAVVSPHISRGQSPISQEGDVVEDGNHLRRISTEAENHESNRRIAVIDISESTDSTPPPQLPPQGSSPTPPPQLPSFSFQSSPMSASSTNRSSHSIASQSSSLLGRRGMDNLAFVAPPDTSQKSIRDLEHQMDEFGIGGGGRSASSTKTIFAGDEEDADATVRNRKQNLTFVTTPGGSSSSSSVYGDTPLSSDGLFGSSLPTISATSSPPLMTPQIGESKMISTRVNGPTLIGGGTNNIIAPPAGVVVLERPKRSDARRSPSPSSFSTTTTQSKHTREPAATSPASLSSPSLHTDSALPPTMRTSGLSPSLSPVALSPGPSTAMGRTDSTLEELAAAVDEAIHDMEGSNDTSYPGYAPISQTRSPALNKTKEQLISPKTESIKDEERAVFADQPDDKGVGVAASPVTHSAPAEAPRRMSKQGKHSRNPSVTPPEDLIKTNNHGINFNKYTIGDYSDNKTNSSTDDDYVFVTSTSSNSLPPHGNSTPQQGSFQIPAHPPPAPPPNTEPFSYQPAISRHPSLAPSVSSLASITQQPRQNSIPHSTSTISQLVADKRPSIASSVYRSRTSQSIASRPWPGAMSNSDIKALKTSGERALAYAKKILELSQSDSGYSEWQEMVMARSDPGSLPKQIKSAKTYFQQTGPSYPSDSLGPPRSSDRVVSEASSIEVFPTRPGDTYQAQEIRNISPPSFEVPPKNLPYPQLAVGMGMRSSQSSQSVRAGSISGSSGGVTNDRQKGSIGNKGSFFQALGRRSSLASPNGSTGRYYPPPNISSSSSVDISTGRTLTSPKHRPSLSDISSPTRTNSLGDGRLVGSGAAAAAGVSLSSSPATRASLSSPSAAPRPRDGPAPSGPRVARQGSLQPLGSSMPSPTSFIPSVAYTSTPSAQPMTLNDDTDGDVEYRRELDDLTEILGGRPEQVGYYLRNFGRAEGLSRYLEDKQNDKLKSL